MFENRTKVLDHLDRFHAMMKEKGMKTPGKIITRNNKINVVFFDKKTQKEWVNYCKENNLVIDSDLEY